MMLLYLGFSGKVVIDENGNRLPIYRIYGKSDGAENDRISHVIIETNGNNTVSLKILISSLKKSTN
jgi:hypothetical protein